MFLAEQGESMLKLSDDESSKVFRRKRRTEMRICLSTYPYPVIFRSNSPEASTAPLFFECKNTAPLRSFTA